MKLFEMLFGQEKKKSEKASDPIKSFALDREALSDGAVISDFITDATGGISSIPYDLAQIPVEEVDLINSYRNLAASSEVDEALHEIRNEVFIFDVPGERAVELAFTEEEGAPPVSIQKKIIEEYRQIYQLLEFQRKGIEYFDDWYVDSRIIFHKIIDENDPKAGIQKLIQIDPLQIRKIRLVPRQEKDGTIDHSKIKEMYVYSNSFSKNSGYSMSNVTDVYYGTNINGMAISPDAITYVHSGLYDRSVGRYVGHLKKAILPFNNLRMMEDAMLIFRVVRAPQRRAFYIDVSSMQKNKAEEYMKGMMARFKNKMVYDSKTGSLSDRRNIQSMMEDYWLPRRDGSRGTEIQTLEGQDSTSALEEVEYYRDKLWRALNVPRSRFAEAANFVFGKNEEIQRDEYRFRKFLTKLRNSFMFLFEDLLKTQLVLKKVIVEDEWDDIRRYMFWNFTEDNSFVEYKESEIIKNRVEMLSIVDPYVGKYFSKEWVLRKILKMNDDEIEKEEIRKEEDTDEDQSSSDEEGFDDFSNETSEDEGNIDDTSENEPVAEPEAGETEQSPETDTGEEDNRKNDVPVI